jgi:hypothetical protein
MTQKMIFINEDKLEPINELLAEGYKVVSMAACGTGVGGDYLCEGSPYCYVLLEK